MASDKEKNSKTISLNKRARYDYTIGDTLEAGIVLVGTEVKTLRSGQVNITQSYADEMDGEIFLFGLHIPEYQQAGRHLQHDPNRPRKLLMKKREIAKLIGAIQQKGVTLVPMSLYFNSRGIVKVKIGIATGKKKHEKRETIKKRDWQRDKARIMKHDM